MKQASIDGIELGYEVTGAGEPMLLMHPALLPGGMRLLSEDDRLTSRHQMIRFNRRGMAPSTGAGKPITVARQAQDAADLLDLLELDRVHLCGYSYGGCVALEFAAAYPERLRSLSLLEPILRMVPSAAEFGAASAPLAQKYVAGDVEGAVTGMYQGALGPKWRELAEAADPGIVERGISAGAAFFESEGPSLGDWTVDAERFGAVKVPVLSVVGTESAPFFAEGRALLHEWFPQAVDADITDATHGLLFQQPRQVVEALADFTADI